MQENASDSSHVGRQFDHFATHEADQASPLYARLCRAIAKDVRLLELAAHSTSGPVPNLFLAAVQYLLRHEPNHPLQAYYPTLGGSSMLESDPVPLFRAFCLQRAAAIQLLLRTRRVQTNEVRRCALLLPAFGLVAEEAAERPLALVEIGTSAGFNLLWDKYAYDYGDGRVYGTPGAHVRLACELRGERPPLPGDIPRIASRLGVDLNPIDVRDEDAVNWLRALVWPEHTARLERLDHAVEMVRAAAPPLIAGDALDLLPDVLAAVPPNALLCLYHTFTINQFSSKARAQFHELLDDHGTRHDLCCVSISGAAEPELRLLRYRHGRRDERVLARCEPHGQWLAWLGSD